MNTRQILHHITKQLTKTKPPTLHYQIKQDRHNQTCILVHNQIQKHKHSIYINTTQATINIYANHYQNLHTIQLADPELINKIHQICQTPSNQQK